MLANLNDIDLKLLRVFMAVVQDNGVSAAQNRLRMSQSTISAHLATLETRLGFRLCERGRGGFSLTPKGERMVIACQALFSAAQDFTRTSMALNGLLTGELHIGVVDNLASLPGNPLSQALKYFHQRRHSVRLQNRICSPGEIEQGLLNRQLDIGIGYFGQQLGQLHYRPWLEETQGIYCGVGHPLYALAEPDRQQIESARWVERGYVLARELCPVSPRHIDSLAFHMESVVHLILSGEYLGYLPTHYAARWVEQGALRRLGGEALSYNAMLYVVTRPHPEEESLLALLEDFTRASGD